MFEWFRGWFFHRKLNRLKPVDVYEVASGVEGNEVEPELSPYADPFDGFAVDVPVEDFIDLHTFAADETRAVLDAYLEAAIEKGFSEVRIIHGRGKGVQRRITHSYLERHPGVSDYYDAPPEQGGWGATVAVLK